MLPELVFRRPAVVETGRNYLWRARAGAAVRVRVVAIDACPAVVIASDRLGRLLRCARERLYLDRDRPRQ